MFARGTWIQGTLQHGGAGQNVRRPHFLPHSFWNIHVRTPKGQQADDVLIPVALKESSSYREPAFRRIGVARPRAKSGITGVVIQVGHPGPSRAGDPPSYYSGPLEVVRVDDQRQVATAHSNKNGEFVVKLPPGSYFITQSDRSLSWIRSQEIVVEEGKMTSVKIYADNGMR